MAHFTATVIVGDRSIKHAVGSEYGCHMTKGWFFHAQVKVNLAVNLGNPQS